MNLSQTASIFMEWYPCQRAPATLLAMLFEYDGRTVTYEAIEAALGLSRGATRNHVFRLHAVMDPGACEAVTGRGYRLTEIGLKDCRAALTDARQRRAAA